MSDLMFFVFLILAIVSFVTMEIGVYGIGVFFAVLAITFGVYVFNGVIAAVAALLFLIGCVIVVRGGLWFVFSDEKTVEKVKNRNKYLPAVISVVMMVIGCFAVLSGTFLRETYVTPYIEEYICNSCGYEAGREATNYCPDCGDVFDENDLFYK